MKKRLLSLLMALVMLLGLLPTAAWAAETEETPLGEEAVAAPATEEVPNAPAKGSTPAELAEVHSHPVCGAACAHEGEDAHEAVAFTSALTGDTDGKLYIDGVEAALDAEYNAKYVLPAGNYYLDGDIALGKPITTLQEGTVNLCFNGHTITYANDEIGRFGAFEAAGPFNACDCQGGGGITDARTFPNGNQRFLMYVSSTCTLYGGEYIGADGSAYGGKTIYSRGNLTVDGATITGSDYAILQENYSTMTIKSGTMTGPVSVNSTRTNFVMEGGTIVNEGGGALSAGGGTIRGGTAQGKLGLVVERATQPVILSGKPTVKGSESDIYFPYPGTNSALLQVSDDLEGVYTLSGSASAITADAPFTFTTPADKDYSAHFVPADTSQGIRDVVDEATGKHTLQLYKVHSHPICGAQCTHQGAHTAVAWTNWDKADSLPTTAGNYVLTGDVTFSTSWDVPEGTTNLCLNGHTVTRGSSGNDTYAITVPEGATLNLCDCGTGGTIDGNNKNYTISTLGELSLYGGKLDGANTVVDVGYGGVFRMHGGSVQGHGTASKGVLVRENCTFLMDGGTITGNCMGVAVEEDGIFRAEGNVVIHGNSSSSGSPQNVVMYSKYEITQGPDGPEETVVPVPMELSGPLGGNAKLGLGLHSWRNMEKVSPYLAVQGAGGYTVTAADFAKLSSDKAEEYPIKLKDGKVYFTVPQTHTHPVCGAECGHEGTDAHEAVTYTALTQAVVDGYEVQHYYDTGVYGTSYDYITIPAGRYYLEEDITTDKAVKLGGDVDLCFNGCTFTSTFADTRDSLGALMLSDNAVFNVCDCQGGGGFTSDGEYGLVTDYHEGKNCAVNLYGGTFTGGYPVELGVSADTTLTVDGAALTATKGNALSATDGMVTIKSGQLTSQYNYGGAVDVRCDDFTLTGGTIVNTGKGTALEVWTSEPVKLSGSPVIRGGEECDICLWYASCKLEVGDLTGSYRVAAGSTVREDTPWVITAPADADQSGHFTLPDTDAYKTRQLKDVVDEATGKHTLQLIQNHAWATAWTSDATAHWHECAAAGCTITANADKDGYATHTPGSWQTDAANHWKVCTVCGYELDKAAHVYDNDQDTTCNTCGYTRTVTSEHTHTWAAGWSKDDTHHWHECTADGCTITANADKDGYAAHTWNDGEVTTPPTASNEGVKTYTCTVCQATRTESVPKLTFGVSGIVTDHEGSELAGVTVTLMQGNTVIATATTDSQGNYSFEDIPAGLYNVAAEKEGVTKTVLVEVTDASATGQNIQMPEGNKNSVVEIKENTPAAVVGGVDAVAEAETVAPGDTVTVKLTVEAKETPTDKDELEAVISGKKDDVLYLDLSLVKQVNDQEPEAISDTGDKVLEIVVPYDFTGKKDVTVYRKHGSDPAAALDKADTKADGTYRLDEAEGKVYIYASKFSTYAIGYTAETAKPSRPVIVIQPEEPPVWPFVDVGEDDWFYGGVKYVYEQGLMEGTSSSTFAPAMGTSRAMIATIIWRLAGSPETETEPTYLDCVKDSWYAAAVAWGTEQGVVKGFSRSVFAPDQTITREQMAAMLWRYAGCVGLDTKADPKTLNRFADGDSTGDWAVDSVAWCVERGILKGKGGNVLAPAAQVTRAEAATMLERFIALLK